MRNMSRAMLSVAVVLIVIAFGIGIVWLNWRSGPADRGLQTEQPQTMAATVPAMDPKVAIAREWEAMAAELAVATKSTLDFEPVPARLVNRQQLSKLYYEVTGPLDRVYRSPEWLGYGLVQHLVTPAVMRLEVAFVSLEESERVLGIVEGRVEGLQSPEVMKALRERLIREAPTRLMKFDASPADFASDLQTLANEMFRLYDPGPLWKTFDLDAHNRTLASWEQACGDAIIRGLRRHVRVADVGWLLRGKPPTADASLQGTLERDRLRATVSALRLLIKARQNAITDLRQLLVEKVSYERVAFFHEELVGPVDSIALMVKACRDGGITSPAFMKVVDEEFRKHVFNDADVNQVGELMRQRMHAAFTAATAQAFDGSSIPGIAPGDATVVKVGTGERPIVGERSVPGAAETIINALELPLLAADVALMVGGAAGAPVSGGVSLVATVAGGLHMAWQLTTDALSVTDKHCLNAGVTSSVQDQVVSAYVGTDGKPAHLFKAALTIGKRSHDGLMLQSDRAWLAEFEQALHKILPDQQ